jgi:hypothetical protein
VKYPWLKSTAVELVAGKFDPTKGVQFPWNLLPGTKNMEASDLRDWETIRNWAVDMAKQFQPA